MIRVTIINHDRAAGELNVLLSIPQHLEVILALYHHEHKHRCIAQNDENYEHRPRSQSTFVFLHRHQTRFHFLLGSRAALDELREIAGYVLLQAAVDTNIVTKIHLLQRIENVIKRAIIDNCERVIAKIDERQPAISDKLTRRNHADQVVI